MYTLQISMFNLKKHFILSIIVCLFFPSIQEAQNTPTRDFVISAQGHYGYIMSHRNNMSHLIKGHIYGAELNYIFRTDGTKPWQQTHNYPEVGVCLLHMYLANPEQLGTLEAIYPYTNIRLNKQNRTMSLNLRLALGLGYATKSFDRITDHKNNVLGSRFNAFVNIRLNTVIKLSDSWRVDAGVGLSHASNGAFKTPNLGLNMTTVNLGLGYVFGNKTLNLKKDTIPRCEKKWQPSVIAVFGMKELESPGGMGYLAYGLQFNVYRTLNYKNKIGGGLEVAYNNATIQRWADDDANYQPVFGDILQAGAKFSYSFNMHRLSLPIDFGVYFYKKQHVNGIFFHRIGLRYMVTKHIIANVTLLTHWAKADYFEWGLGYQF